MNEEQFFMKNYLSKGIDTLDIQLQDLCSFTEMLGYSHNHLVGGGQSFHIWKQDGKSRRYISLDTAVRLYNGTLIRVCGDIVDCLGIRGRDLIFDRERFFKAQRNKTFDKVYLQRYNGELKVHNNWLRINTRGDDE